MIVSSIFLFKIFYPIYIAKEVIISYGIHPFDICEKNLELWNFIKLSYIFVALFSNFLIGHFIYIKIFDNIFTITKKLIYKVSNFKNDNHFKLNQNTHPKKSNNFSDSLSLRIGELQNSQEVYIPESGLYQNFLITGTIGSGKTSSAMYPFTRQLLEFNSKHLNRKIGMLILDVKGNYYKQVKDYAQKYNLNNDLIVLELGSKVFYNPLHKPFLKANVLANRLKTILLLFSENNSESYWLDKAEEVLCECIKLCRRYNNRICYFSRNS